MEFCKSNNSNKTKENLVAALKATNGSEKTSHKAMLTIARLAFEWGESLQWSSTNKNADIKEMKQFIKAFKMKIEFGTSKIACILSMTQPNNASSDIVIDFCSIASGIQFLKEIGDPYVLKENDCFEMCLLDYLERCPKMKKNEIPESVSKIDLNSHWWWQYAMEILIL